MLPSAIYLTSKYLSAFGAVRAEAALGSTMGRGRPRVA